MPQQLSPERKSRYRDFIDRHRLAVLASRGPDGQPQAALMNIAVTAELEIIFETTCETRKFANLEQDSRVALVMGWDGQETLQMEGLAARPEGRRREEIRDAFLAAFPEKASHQHWPGNCFYIVTPSWIRFSSYYRPRTIEETLLMEPKPQAGCWARMNRIFGGRPSLL